MGDDFQINGYVMLIYIITFAIWVLYLRMTLGIDSRKIVFLEDRFEITGLGAVNFKLRSGYILEIDEVAIGKKSSQLIVVIGTEKYAFRRKTAESINQIIEYFERVKKEGNSVKNSEMNLKDETEFKVMDKKVIKKAPTKNPLILACRRGDFEEVVSLLNQIDAEINIQDENGMTALMNACMYGCVKIVEVLLKQNKIDVNLVDDRGNSALCIACSGYELLKDDLQSGKLNSDSCEKITIVQMLLKNSKINVNIQNYQGYTPLMLAAYYGQENIFKYLIENTFVNYYLVNEKNQTVLDISREKNQQNMFKTLKNLGVNK